MMRIHQTLGKRQRRNKARRGQRALRLETLEKRELLATFMLTDDWADVEKSPENSDDDALCWAAAAANVLEWTGWGKTHGMADADQMFQHLQDHWEDGGNEVRDAWSWWFDGVDPDAGNPDVTNVDVAGGGRFWPAEPFSDFYHRDSDPVTMMRSLDAYMHSRYGVVLSILNDGGGDHFITAWGYEYDPAHPDNYTSVHVTDSDDDKNLVAPPDVLDARDVVFDEIDNRWYIGNRRFGFNPDEFKVEGTPVITPAGVRLDMGELKGGIAVQDDATGQGFIMYSEDSVHDRFDGPGAEPHKANSHHLIAVKHDRGHWHYNNNNLWFRFTPRSTDLLLAQVDFDLDTITSLQGDTGEESGIAKGFADGDLQFHANRFGGDWYIASVRALEQIPNHLVPPRLYDAPEFPRRPHDPRGFDSIKPEFRKKEHHRSSPNKDVSAPAPRAEEQPRSKAGTPSKRDPSSDQRTTSKSDKSKAYDKALGAVLEELGKTLSI